MKNTVLRKSCTALLIASLFLSTSNAEAATFYYVKKGDTLSKISKETGVSVSELMKTNHLTNTLIKVGQKLNLPSTDVIAKDDEYIVKKGDTLYKIAKQFNLSVSELKTQNKLGSDTLRIGQVLKIKKNFIPTTPTIPNINKEVTKDVLGFTYEKGSESSITNNLSKITSIATASHIVDSYGNIKGKIWDSQISISEENNIKPVVMIGNEYKQDVARDLLSSKTNRKNMVDQTMKLLKTNKFRGVNIDIEHIPVSERNNYTSLIKEMRAALNGTSYEFSIAVAAKTMDDPRKTWNYAYDYKAIAPYVDYIEIMAYDEHYKTSAPGPVASYGWIKDIVDYSLTVIPANKIVLGIPSYGYDWAGVGRGVSRSYSQVMELADKYNTTIKMDPVSKEQHFTYRDSAGILHEVWFENAATISYKLDLVNAKNLRGIGIWRVGVEDPNFWKVIAEKF